MALTGGVTIGIASIVLQEIDAEGANVGAAISLGYTKQDTFNITTDEGTPFVLEVEELDKPLLELQREGSMSITWICPNVDTEALAKVTSGTYSALTGYDAPAKKVTKEYKVTVTPEQGMVLTLHRVSLSAMFNGTFGKNNELQLTVNGSVLSPLDGSTPYNLKAKV